jgi:JAB domain-containing protein similar to deubiquitination enzymes
MGVPALVLAILVASGPPCTPPARPPDTMLDWLSNAPLRVALDRLFARAQYGLAPYESAAWIVRERGGDVALRDWDFTGRAERAAWRGPAPDGALAIVHTHPDRADPRPSSVDAALARRLGLPVYTLTRHGLWVARPDGTVLLEVPAPRACARVACLP